DPLQACSGYTAPTGLPVFIEVGGNVPTTASPTHSFTGNGVPLAHCIIDSTVPSVGSNLTNRGAVIVIPRAPLQSGRKFVVAVNVNSVNYTWSFTVGPFWASPVLRQASERRPAAPRSRSTARASRAPPASNSEPPQPRASTSPMTRPSPP